MAKKISGQVRLTEVAMKNLQKYYGIAIIRHKNETLEQMKKGEWAGFIHVSSNENPNHSMYDHGKHFQ